jgi:hypothetical protein
MVHVAGHEERSLNFDAFEGVGQKMDDVLIEGQSRRYARSSIPNGEESVGGRFCANNTRPSRRNDPTLIEGDSGGRSSPGQAPRLTNVGVVNS